MGRSSADFMEEFTHKSDGNFMYLRHVLPELESGAYRNTEISVLPEGLVNYYQDHWRRMKGAGGDRWFQYKVPILAALAHAPGPVTSETLARLSDVSQSWRVDAVLDEWRAFIRPEDGATPTRKYRLYHASYADFVTDQDDIRVASDRLRRRLQRALFSGDNP